MAERPAIVSCVFYKDPIAAMKWLEAAFGFETTTLLTDADGNVGHAEMSFLGAPVAIGGEWAGPQLGGAQMKAPASLGGAGTQFIRIELPEGLDGHCDRARAAGETPGLSGPARRSRLESCSRESSTPGGR